MALIDSFLVRLLCGAVHPVPASVIPARRGDFLQLFQRDFPRPLPHAKIFRFARTPNHPYNSCHPVPRRGALAIVTNVGAGCGGRGSVGRVDVVAGRFYRERTQRAGRTALKRLRHCFGRQALGWLKVCGRGSCVRQNRVVLAPVAGVKLAEVLRNPTGFDGSLICR
jgi:hypothetical protein